MGDMRVISEKPNGHRGLRLNRSHLVDLTADK
jgi:hypothetical protein